jgi:hypothetical protein
LQEPGGTLTGNIVYKNTCSHTGIGGYGFEVDDVWYELNLAGAPAIAGNTIAFNDLRGSTFPFVWYGDESANSISRNLGRDDNRGEGSAGLTPAEIFD